MKLKHQQHDQITVVELTGELTADDIEPLKRLANECLEDNTRDFVINLDAVEFIDSCGLETLLWLRDKAGEQLGQLRLVHPNETIQQILHITRLTNSFDTHEDVDTAIESLR